MVILALAGCDDKGAPQKAGESVDKAVTAVSDTVDTKDPAEKAGRSTDEATDSKQ